MSRTPRLDEARGTGATTNALFDQHLDHSGTETAQMLGRCRPQWSATCERWRYQAGITGGSHNTSDDPRLPGFAMLVPTKATPSFLDRPGEAIDNHRVLTRVDFVLNLPKHAG